MKFASFVRFIVRKRKREREGESFEPILKVPLYSTILFYIRRSRGQSLKKGENRRKGDKEVGGKDHRLFILRLRDFASLKWTRAISNPEGYEEGQ